MLELVEMPMYRKSPLDGHVGRSILEIMTDNTSFRCYCNDCLSESIFVGELPVTLDFGTKINLSTNATGPNELSFDKRYICQLESSHVITLSFKVNGAHIQKIGQYPSVADMQSAKYANYKKMLEKNGFSELKKANLLHSFSMNIGAFIYLRRIIEDLVMSTYAENKTEIDNESENFLALHFDKKTKLLGKFLPDFFTSNPAIYGLISKGVHELSEEECEEHYETILEGVLMILDEKQAKIEKRKRQIEIEKKLATASIKFKKAK